MKLQMRLNQGPNDGVDGHEIKKYNDINTTEVTVARGAARDGSCSRTRRQRRKVDKCRVADKKQTDKQTHTTLL